MKTVVLLCILLISITFGMSVAEIEPTAHNVALIGVGLAVVSMVAPKGVIMMSIGLEQARGAFTNALIAKYSEDVSVPGFFRSFFKNQYSPTRYVSFALQRSNERVAVDILRGTGANYNQKTRSTIKTLEPPYFAEKVIISELDIYQTAWSSLDPAAYAELLQQANILLIEEKKTIERRYELMCKEALTSGIITLASGDNIDYKRKVASMPSTTSGDYWTVNTVDPMTLIEQGGKFIREQGKAQGGVYNVILGAKAWNAMNNNPIFRSNYDIRHIMNGVIGMPQSNGTGATFRGQVAGASYIYNFWTYGEVYQASNGSFVPLMDEDKIIVLGENPNYVMQFAQVPMLQGLNETGALVRPMGNDGQFWFKEYLDVPNDNHVQEIRSAGVPIPVAIDTMFTVKVVA